MTTKPRYVERGGELVLRQPIRCSNTTMYTWLVEGDWDALHALCDQAFAQPSGGAVVVRPLLPMVAVVAAEIGHGQSTLAPDRDKGWCPERVVGWWGPGARATLDGDRFEVEQIGWYQPYLFIDNPSAVFTGRETYGFAKSIGTCTMPRRPDDPSRFAVTTQVIETFTPGTEATFAELFRIERADGGPLGALVSTFESVLEAFAKVEARLLLRAFGRGALPIPTLTLVKNLYDGLREGLVPMFFLKQFRDVADGSRACYQAIVEAAADLHSFRGGGFLDDHLLTIRAVDSHPIARDLGLAPGAIETGWGYWAAFDFTIADGKVLWEAGGQAGSG
jgi:hypothetical protein